MVPFLNFGWSCLSVFFFADATRVSYYFVRVRVEEGGVMNTSILVFYLSLVVMSVVSCSGLKVINPNDQNKNAGTLALDLSEGGVKLVATYTCKLESMGNRFSAVGKTEEETRKEVLARCRDNTLISFCDAEKVHCLKN